MPGLTDELVAEIHHATQSRKLWSYLEGEQEALSEKTVVVVPKGAFVDFIWTTYDCGLPGAHHIDTREGVVPCEHAVTDRTVATALAHQGAEIVHYIPQGNSISIDRFFQSPARAIHSNRWQGKPTYAHDKIGVLSARSDGHGVLGLLGREQEIWIATQSELEAALLDLRPHILLVIEQDDGSHLQHALLWADHVLELHVVRRHNLVLEAGEYEDDDDFLAAESVLTSASSKDALRQVLQVLKSPWVMCGRSAATDLDPRLWSFQPRTLDPETSVMLHLCAPANRSKRRDADIRTADAVQADSLCSLFESSTETDGGAKLLNSCLKAVPILSRQDVEARLDTTERLTQATKAEVETLRTEIKHCRQLEQWRDLFEPLKAGDETLTDVEASWVRIVRIMTAIKRMASVATRLCGMPILRSNSATLLFGFDEMKEMFADLVDDIQDAVGPENYKARWVGYLNDDEDEDEDKSLQISKAMWKRPPLCELEPAFDRWDESETTVWASIDGKAEALFGDYHASLEWEVLGEFQRIGCYIATDADFEKAEDALLDPDRADDKISQKLDPNSTSGQWLLLNDSDDEFLAINIARRDWARFVHASVKHALNRWRSEFGAHVNEFLDRLSLLDMLQAFSSVARNAEPQWVKPNIRHGSEKHLELLDARHPLLSRAVPFDVAVTNALKPIRLVFGPNESGKSTLLRTVGFVVCLALLGSLVPCKTATIPLYNAILCRIGAQDDASRGMSTFAMEAADLARIVERAHVQSLVLMDELGRGTEARDGIALAHATLEYLDVSRATVFLATHYHSLGRGCEGLAGAEVICTTFKEGMTEVTANEVDKLPESSGAVEAARRADVPVDVTSHAELHAHGSVEGEQADVHVREWMKELCAAGADDDGIEGWIGRAVLHFTT